MKWEDVIKRDDIVGGEIEVQDMICICRGPIASITIVNGFVDITTTWIARFNKKRVGDGWHEVEKRSFLFDVNYCPPFDIGECRIATSLFGIGPCVIFLKGGSTLGVALVKWMDKK